MIVCTCAFNCAVHCTYRARSSACHTNRYTNKVAWYGQGRSTKATAAQAYRRLNVPLGLSPQSQLKPPLRYHCTLDPTCLKPSTQLKSSIDNLVDQEISRSWTNISPVKHMLPQYLYFVHSLLLLIKKFCALEDRMKSSCKSDPLLPDVRKRDYSRS